MWNWPETALSGLVYAKLKPGVLGTTQITIFTSPHPASLQYTGTVLAGRRCGALVSCPRDGHQTIRNRLCQRRASPSPGAAGRGRWRGGDPHGQPLLGHYHQPHLHQHPISLLTNSTLCSQGNNLLYLPSQNSTQSHTRLIKNELI